MLVSSEPRRFESHDRVRGRPACGSAGPRFPPRLAPPFDDSACFLNLPRIEPVIVTLALLGLDANLDLQFLSQMGKVFVYVVELLVADPAYNRELGLHVLVKCSA